MSIKEAEKRISDAIDNGGTILDLCNLGLEELPESICEIRQLKKLYLWDNELKELPESIGELPQLTEINLSRNKMSRVPECIKNLTRLNSLYLTRNNIKNLPEYIGLLKNLKTLSLSRNDITSLPESFGSLSSLQKLDLSNNKLEKLPESLGTLTCLEELNLAVNKLKILPNSVGDMERLKKLDVRENVLSSLPNTIGAISRLTFLHLSENILTSIPSSIGKLSELIELNLANNRIDRLPSAIGGLKNLRHLDLSNNKLITLPPSFGQLRRSMHFYIAGNSLEKPPREIVERGIESIQDYFQQIEEQKGSDYLYECKLLIVGDPGAGKTTLLKKLLDPEYPVPNNQEPSTVGVNVCKWEYEAKNDRQKQIEFRVNLWDFGGHKIQYMTHQFFLTSRSFYVLVSDHRAKRTNFDYWFNMIDILGEKSPLLVLLNEINHHSVENFNTAYYKKHYPGLIKEIRDVDFSRDDGRYETMVDHLKNHLLSLRHIGDELPKQWIPIRKHLEKLQAKHNYIDRKQYSDICKEHGITGETQQLTLSQYLHDLGVILHFQNDDDIAQWVVLNPQWVTAAVYTILSDKKVYKQGGRFDKKWLFARWSDYKFEEKRYLLLLMLKNRFDICYPTDKNQEHYIVPQLLPQQEPEYLFDRCDNLLFRYQFKFMPFGLIARIIVRLSDDVDIQKEKAVNWHAGILLKRNNVSALLEENTSEEGSKIIDIRVSGSKSERKDYLAYIRRAIENILDESYKQITYDEMIPCNHCLLRDVKEVFYIPYKHLSTFIDKGKTSNACGVCGEDYSPFELVYGIYSQEELKNKHVTINYHQHHEGTTMGDRIQVGQGVAYGRNSHVHDINFSQIWNQEKSNIDIEDLAQELATLRKELLNEAKEPAQFSEIGNIASAEEEAKNNNGAKALEYLSKVSKWGLGVAEKIGVAVATSAIKSAIDQITT